MKLGRLLFLLGLATGVATATAAEKAPPNIVLIFVDNLGNGDIGCFGSTLHRTPNIDRLAAEGTKFTSFYVASGVCSPSRAALLTGCYPRRVNLHVSGNNGAVLRPLDTKGLHPEEITIAEVLKPRGYATGIFGKWHLGDQREFLPTRQGFDYFFGLPYSDDMTKNKSPDTWPELPLMRNEEVIEAPPDRDYLVKRTTEEVIAFIEKNQRRPFFAYIPHTMPGSTPHPFSSPAFKGKSRNGVYGDSVEELDWSTGEIMRTLKRLGLDENTLVIWTSDNGAVKRTPQQGSGAPYRGFSYDTTEGAMRMPCVMRWPGRIPAGKTNDELCSTMDLLPTFARLAETPGPSKRIDGRDIRSLLFGEPNAKSHWNETGYAFYAREDLQAIRADQWKLYLPASDTTRNQAKKSAPATAQLFDVRTDVHEDKEVSAQNPAVVARLLKLADNIRAEIGDGQRTGPGQRPAGHVANPRPLLPARR